MGKSKVLVIGGTGYIGKHVAKAGARLGHPTYVLVRNASPSDPARAELYKSLTDAGIQFLTGDLTDHDALVAALKQVDVVIATVDFANTLNQIQVIDAIKEVGHIKRYLPSEFGNNVDRLEMDVKVTEPLFATQAEVRRYLEKSGVPYTLVISGSFNGYYLATLGQDNTYTPPRDKAFVWGDGNAKVIFSDEDDIGTYTILAADDPRTENKLLNIRPKDNVISQSQAIELWEQKIGSTLEKTYVDKEGVLKLIDESPFPGNLFHGIRYSIFVKGDQTSFELTADKDVEVTELYPDVKYTTPSAYLDRFL